MGKAAVVNMKGEIVNDGKAKKPRERISCLEERPSPDWFVRCKTPQGQTQWFMRIAVTGISTRLYGPFASKHRCLLFLDAWHGGSMADATSDAADVQQEYEIPQKRFGRRFAHYPMVEREIIKHAPSVNRKKPGAA